MRAARLFVSRLAHEGWLTATTRPRARLYGSVGATGKGHGTDKAVLLGLMGAEPDTVDVEHIGAELERASAAKAMGRLGTHEVAFDAHGAELLTRARAINAARITLRGDGTHHASLDKVVETMRETGADLMTNYKETARGGLAVNIVER